MLHSNNGKLLWDNKRFSKLYSSAERLTGAFATTLLVQAGIPNYPAEKPLIVLDNACGTGVITKALHEIQKDRSPESLEITCGDFADSMVESITQCIQDSVWKNTKALKVDAQDTKLPSDYFTHVFTNFGVMLVPNPSAVLSECHRMLQPRGVCAFTTWKRIGWFDDFREAFDSMQDLPPFPTPERMTAAFGRGHWDDEAFVDQQLIEHGFDNIRVEAVPNISTAEDKEQLRAVLKLILATVYRFWTEEQREQHANESTEKRLEQWIEQKYGGGPVQWHWIALVTTSNKAEKP